MLSPDRLGTALDTPKTAAAAWDFLTSHWEAQSAPVKIVVTERRLGTALCSSDWCVALAVWDFVIEHWPRLPERLQGVLSTERIEQAARSPLVSPTVAEFFETHAAASSQAPGRRPTG